MTSEQTKVEHLRSLNEQIELAKKRFAEMPQWMQDASVFMGGTGYEHNDE